MADLYGMFFFIQFFLALALTLFRFYNVMRLWSKKGPVYELPIAFISFIGFLIIYGIGLVTFLVGFAEPLFLALFQMESFIFLGLNVLFFIIEIIYLLTNRFMKDAVQARNAKEEYYAE